MTIETQLDTLRGTDGSIESATYLDMRSGTVLYSCAGSRPAQEKLDALCAMATEVLGGVDGEAAEAMTLRSTEALIFHRSPQHRTEALCLVCAPDADLDRALSGAREALGGGAAAGPGSSGPRGGSEPGTGPGTGPGYGSGGTGF